jgi:serine/threonine-protein kinase HipA
MDFHIDVFVNDQWHPAAHVDFSNIVRNGFRGTDCVFQYTLDYAFGAIREPVSLTWPVDTLRHQCTDWPAFLYDLIPQGNGRRFLLGQLSLADSQASDVPLLCAGAFNSIGRLRIREAVRYYE